MEQVNSLYTNKYQEMSFPFFRLTNDPEDGGKFEEPAVSTGGTAVWMVPLERASAGWARIVARSLATA